MRGVWQWKPSARGVVLTPLLRNVSHYHGDVEWFTFVEPISDGDRTRMMHFAQHRLGKEHGTWKVIFPELRVLFSKDVEKRDTPRKELKSSAHATSHKSILRSDGIGEKVRATGS